MRVESFLEESARRSPDVTALVCGGARLSYAQLERQANGFARGLLEHGVQRGDRVAVCLDNGVPIVVSLFGVWKAGAVPLLVNASTKGDKLRRLVDDAEPSALLIGGRKLAEVGDAVASARSLRFSVAVGERAESAAAAVPWDDLVGAGADGPPDKRHIDLDLAALLYTSGSSGTPKGVMHTHQSIASVTRTIAGYLENHAGDVVLQVLPMSFGYGLTQLLTMVSVGGTLVLERGFAFPQAALDKIEKERVTGLAMVPTVAALLLENGLREGGPRDVTSLRYLTNAGAGMPPALARRVREALPSVRLYLMYGQTECIRASFLPPEEIDRRPASVGRGMPDSEVWLVDDEGRRVGRGGSGELVIRGAHVMRGYWRLDEATAQKLRPGPIPGERVLHTGDLFRLDEEGWLHFVSRKDDIIKTRGEKVSPKEVEDALCDVEGVLDAAVVGVPDVLLGEAVAAFVRLQPGSDLDARALKGACAARLEDFAVPKHVEIVAEMPKNTNGKVDKRALRARHAERNANGNGAGP